MAGFAERRQQELRFIHISTDEVYGSLAGDDPPFCETSPYAPNSPYAASKAGADHLVRSFHRTYGLPVITTNCSNNYGPHQFPEKLIPLTIHRALEDKAILVCRDDEALAFSGRRGRGQVPVLDRELNERIGNDQTFVMGDVLLRLGAEDERELKVVSRVHRAAVPHRYSYDARDRRRGTSFPSAVRGNHAERCAGLAFQYMRHHPVGQFLGAGRGGIEMEIGRLRRVVGGIEPGEILDQSRASLGVEALRIALHA